jgi:hypothetical protein
MAIPGGRPADRSDDETNWSTRQKGVVARLNDLVPSLAGPAGSDRLLPDRLAQAAAQVLDVDGAAISVYLGADVAAPVGSSDETTAIAESLQFTLAEGPCLYSYAKRVPVLLPDVSSSDSRAVSLWPTYVTQLTQRTNYQAVFAFPLLFDSRPLGSLSVYRRRPGTLTAVREVSAVASWVSTRLLNARMFVVQDEPFPEWLEGPGARRRETVWIAQGLTMQANRLTPAEALQLLRAQAFTADRLVDDLAADIVEGVLPVPDLREN